MTITFSGRTETVSCSSCPSPVILAVDAEHCDRSVTLSKTPTVLSNFHGTKILFLAQCFVILTLDLTLVKTSEYMRGKYNLPHNSQLDDRVSFTTTSCQLARH